MSSNENKQFLNETPETIEKNEKNEKKSPIKAFVSAKEAESEYMRLWDKEQTLKKAGPPTRPTILCLQKTENEKAWDLYYDELMLFYQRLFRFIVKKDIDAKVPYTIILGLKAKDDGSLTMERLPIQYEQRDDHNALLFALSIYPDNAGYADQLKKFNKINNAPGKSADKFFPKIILANGGEIKEHLDGEYDEKHNIITIPRHNFSLGYCTNILHEFAHSRQRCHMGGKAYLLNKSFSKLPFSIALEFDAEHESIKHHPCPKHLRKLTKKSCKHERLTERVYKKSKMRFPYYTFSEKYLITCSYHKLKGDKSLLLKAQKTHQKLFEKLNKIVGTCLDSDEIGKQNYPNCYRLICDTCIFEQNFKAHTNEIREILLKKEMSKEPSKEKIEAIKKAPNPIFGSQEFFAIKCKALGIEQENNKIENSKNNILEK